MENESITKRAGPGELTPHYDPKQVEDRVYRIWETSGFFAPENQRKDKKNKNKKKTFTIAVPPPNITGSLHMGHALNAVIQDILIRKRRMQGFKTLWIPGTDHASIATQYAVEKELKKEGLTRHDLGKEKFLERVWAWREKYGSTILDQFKKIGSSMDWSRTRFTMDPEYQKAVETAFLYYHKKGWIYRGERPVNWCSRCGTSLSDLELEYQEEKAKFYYIKYGPLSVGTVRPETKLGDTALAVNPKDARYQSLIGKEISIQSVDPEIPREQTPKLKNIKIKVVADQAADPSFGTGVIKVTPAHDQTDFEIYQRHPEIPILRVIDERGRMTKAAGKRFEGMKVLEAREQITKDLQELGLLEKVEDYMHNVSICYRCGTVIEPLLSKQWFLKMGSLAQIAIKAVKKGYVKFHPRRWEKVYFDWLKNIHDWPISRQLWWGQKIPLSGENDVLDTWFSSALWPFAILGWPHNTRDLKEFYPTDVLSTARDILNLWVGRMIFSSMEFTGEVPFRDVIIHATILTKEGKRMSKSLGTGIDPLDLIGRFGADATRFGLIWQAMGGQDIHWSEEHVVAGKKFANKLWNASRYVLVRTEGVLLSERMPASKTPADKKILNELKKVSQKASMTIDRFEFGVVLHDLYEFFWHVYCDKYIEKSKEQLANPRLEASTKAILLYVLAHSLKLLHPFMPFVTEEVWGTLPRKSKNMLIIEAWPE